MTDLRIDIFQKVSNDENEQVSFFGCDDESLLETLYENAIKIIGPTMKRHDPENDMDVKRIGEVTIAHVDDDCIYKVDAIGKPEGGRKPDGQVGTWTIQSLIFSKDNFADVQSVKAWLGQHSSRFGDYGMDETSTSIKSRQYDPEHFSEFRTITLSEGISAVYGRISSQPSKREDAEKEIEASVKRHGPVDKMNKAIIRQGLKLLCGTAEEVVTKEEQGQQEERFILSMVLEPTEGEGVDFKPDTQDDVYTAAEVRKGCHYWMENGGAIDLMHNWEAMGKDDVRILEVYIAPVDFDNGGEKVLKGSWMLALRVVNDALWTAVKEQKLGAYSIGGMAERTPVK